MVAAVYVSFDVAVVVAAMVVPVFLDVLVVSVAVALAVV